MIGCLCIFLSVLFCYRAERKVGFSDACTWFLRLKNDVHKVRKESKKKSEKFNKFEKKFNKLVINGWKKC